MNTPIVILSILLLSSVLHAQDSVRQDQNAIRYLSYKHYKESSFTLGYNYNFGDKGENGKRPEPWHFVELGFWRSHVSIGHHAVMTNYYFANDFGLNTNDFMIGPKAGCFVGFFLFGLGVEAVYYTDFNSGSLRFIPSLGIFTPYFKLTINPHIVITNKEFQDLNKGHVNLTIRVFKISRTDLTDPGKER